jgi:hypothetical protein
MLNRSVVAGTKKLINMKIKMGLKKRSGVRQAWLAKVLARERVIRKQIAERLRRRAARLTRVQLQWCIVLFFSVGFLVYAWIGVRAVSGPQKPVDFIRSGAAARSGVMTKWFQEERATFRSYLDSIEANPVLKGTFDSLRAARPGFADTIRRLEELYPGH